MAAWLHEPNGYGRWPVRVLTDASAALLHPLVTENVGPGATVITDGWQGYAGTEALGYTRERHSQRATRLAGSDPYGLLPGVHRVASLTKRWLLGTYQGSVGDPHLQAYLDESVFRFNRRRSRSRGFVFYRVLELAVDHGPVRYRQLVAGSRPKKVPPVPPGARGHPPSLDRPRAGRPWRSASLPEQVGSDGYPQGRYARLR